MNFSIGFSPCPNDTFIFDALVNKKIDTEGIDFSPVLEDVETLNQWALEGKLDITKLSFPAFFRSLKNYVLLHSGSALGMGVGPLLISKDDPANYREIAEEGNTGYSVALPGLNTTANLLFSFAYPAASNKKYMLFSAIENAVLDETTDLGVIIHENRFTYHERGLHKVADLGEYWEQKMKVPIPLGGIAIRRSIDHKLSIQIDGLIRKSLEYAFENYPAITDYVKQHSQAMSEDVMRQHIDLYVNDYSLSLGKDGMAAIGTLHDVFISSNKESSSGQELFL